MMRRLLIILFLGILACSFTTLTEAKRFGGGKSFGVSRSISSTPHPNTSPLNKPLSAGKKWLAPLAGLLAGGLLASLFMGHGLGSGILSWVLILGGAFIIWRLISRLKSGNQAQQATLQTAPFSAAHTSPSEVITPSYEPTAIDPPSAFDETAFLRIAKTVFIRLQAAYDNKNLTDIREFTSPEVFAEIQMQLQERGNASNITEIINIEATLADLAIESHKLTASVHFSGSLREEPNASPIHIKELWHFDKIKENENWVVVGIQQ